MQFIQNFDLLTVGIAIAGIGLLGFIVYFNNPKSITNQTFLVFSIAAILWSIANYANYQIQDQTLIITLLRLVIYFAVWYSFFLFQLFYVFPEETKVFPKYYKTILFPIVFVTSLLTLSPFIFSKVNSIAIEGQVSIVDVNKIGITMFGIVVIGLISYAIYFLYKKIQKAENIEKKQMQFVFTGALITFTLHLIFNFILPAFFDTTRFIPYGALFTFPLIVFTTYAILRHHLLNLKIIATEILVFALTVGILFDVVVSQDLFSRMMRFSIFLLVIGVGVSLINSVRREVEQREKIEGLNKSLELANQGQANLIHVINHQIKGYLAKSRNIFSELLTEPAYGPVSEASKPMMQEGFNSLTEGAAFVQQILSTASIDKGTFQYTMEKLNFKDIVAEVFEKEKERAEQKKLSFEQNFSDGEYETKGDKMQLKEAIRNLIENSIIYTPSGSIKVNLSNKEGHILLQIVDTGVGIKDEDKARLFTKGGRGTDSIKVNVNSSGYGLAFVKGVIEAHGGYVWAESAGPNQGSAFSVELPRT